MNNNNQIPEIDNTPDNSPNESPLGVSVLSDPQASRASSGDDYRAALQAGDVLGTARTREGTLLNPGEVTKDAIVTVQVEGKGMQMRVSDAERFGFLTKEGDSYRAIAPKATPPVQPEPTPQPDRPELFNSEAETQYSQVTSQIPQELHQRIIREWTEKGQVRESTLLEAANKIPGADPDMVVEHLQRAVDLFNKQAIASIDSQGLPGAEVMAWADTHYPKELDAAMSAHATNRTTKGYGKLAGLYLESLDKIAPKKVLSLKTPEGVSISKDLNGRIIVKYRGGTMSWKDAVAHKVIRFRGAKS